MWFCQRRLEEWGTNEIGVERRMEGFMIGDSRVHKTILDRVSE